MTYVKAFNLGAVQRFIIALALLTSAAGSAVAQETSQTEEHAAATDTADIDMPELIGGLGSIMSDIHYPATARAAGAEGRVVVTFVVGETGGVEEAEVTAGVHPALDREALAAVQRARFVPAHRAGRPLRVRMALPVTFQLPG
jgi:TonB family protein